VTTGTVLFVTVTMGTVPFVTVTMGTVLFVTLTGKMTNRAEFTIE